MDINLKLPETLLKEAQSAGLLKPVELEKLLRAELRRRRVDKLFATADKLAALDEPLLTNDEIEAEIAAARKARVK
ncbi:MAG: hypothetical protein QMD04_04830 [Anaerolineales bacterium]|nr:hypothetical protein [Anaerolineales bacterium]